MITRHFKLTVLFTFFLSFLFLQSCNPCKEDFRLEQDFAIGFSLFDKQTGDNLLEIASYYHPDSEKVRNSLGKEIYSGPVPGDGIIIFRPYRRSELFIPIEKDTIEFYYLHLIKYGQLDVDTFRLDYRVSLDDCSEKKFTNLNFYYNEKLVFSDDQERFDFFVNLYK